MSLLRIYGSLLDQTQHCEWVLISDHREPISGAGRLTDLPQHVERVQLVIPAAEVLITRARIPQSARHRSGSLLAFAIEDKTAADPDVNQVSWLGSTGEEDALAVIDKQGLARWYLTLGAVGIRVDEVHSETLLLPIQANEWSVAWDGSEGFVRTGTFEGAATDSGDQTTPPLFLRLMLEEAKTRDASPTSIALYMTTADAVPDIAAWQHELGTALYIAGTWDWRSAPPNAGISMAQQRERWRGLTGMAARLRPAAWILGAALTLHAVALISDWSILASDQHTLRKQMEMQFRASFPDAVAVVDPALQMRRKLAEARHSAGVADSGDFLPMIVQVAAATKTLPAGTVSAVSYESGQMTLKLTSNENTMVQTIMAHLRQSGLNVDAAPSNDTSTSTLLIIRAS
ncbi:type II secretion system protein GspL [Sulfuriferula thiophila]|uniref:type II secretion system protein GspL n=1 Tax=Sulfuriferula thiophila TaxID=1781211 RepID=UPI001CB8E825|nr:type II secretion system protein GspL [Sulfuriferula thiophila]